MGKRRYSLRSRFEYGSLSDRGRLWVLLDNRYKAGPVEVARFGTHSLARTVARLLNEREVRRP